MNNTEKAITEFIQYCNGDITEDQYIQGEGMYKLTEKDIQEMQWEADRKLFGTY